MTERCRLGSILLESQMISDEDVQRALLEQRRSGIRFGEALIQLGIVKGEDVGWGLANQLNIPFIRLSSAKVDQNAVLLVPEPLARRHNVLPFLKIENELTVVLEDPLNRRAIHEVEAVSNCKVNVCVGLPNEITQKINEVYGTSPGVQNDISELNSDIFSEKERDEIGQDFTGEIFLRTLLDHTIKRRVSAVHFEPEKTEVRIRFRNEHGILQVGVISEGWFLVLNNRLKNLLSQTETRESLMEGFVSHHWNERRFVFYVSIVETKAGNSITMLNLKLVEFPETFDELSIDEISREKILSIIGGRSGLVMVVGPSKTEKLNFIYLLLEKKHAQMKKTFSIGSMPWFADAGYMQISVSVEDRQELLEGIQVALTQDPDIIYIEDLWDKRVLQFTLQQAISNTFFMSTLHFPDSLTALEYANESIENKTLLTTSLRGIIAVHVFRLLCPACKELDTEYTKQSRSLRMSKSDLQKMKIYKAVGCSQCEQTGYQGHEVLLEELVMNQELSSLLKAGHKFSVIQDKISASGHRTIEDQARQKVLLGILDVRDFSYVEKR